MENKNPHINHRKRLYALTEKIGIDNLTDIQAMELLLTYVIPRKDTNEIAHELLDEFGTFAGVLEAPISALEKISGVGHRTAQMISFMKGFFFLFRTSKEKNKKVSFASKGQMMSYISNYLQDSKNEQLYLFGLNSKKEVIKVAKLAEGDETSVVILPRVLIEIYFCSSSILGCCCSQSRLQFTNTINCRHCRIKQNFNNSQSEQCHIF